jgi:hypothetical protein
MYNAPAVSYPVGRSHIKRLITWVLLLLALCVLGFWWHQVPRLAWPQGLGLGLWLVAALLAVRDELHPPSGHLNWDGQDWQWASAGQSWAVEVRPQLDGQRFILLALSGVQSGLDWLWLERAHDPLHWDALRRAVWAQGKTGAGHHHEEVGLVADQP